MTADATQHHNDHSHVAHHFDDAEQQFDAATLGMWVFLVTEVMFFGGLFTIYTIYRVLYPDAFLVGSHLLNVWLGTFNTAVLLLSSFLMAMGVYSAQTGNNRAVAWYLIGTLLLGTCFLGVKGYEYYEKFVHHEVPGEFFHLELHEEGQPEVDEGHVELFFGLYFVMTGVHAIHMVIGGGLLIWMIVLASRNHFSPEYFTPVEMTGLYWHFVDIVWVFLFPLLYLIG